MKKCSICKIEREETKFSKDRSRLDGLNPRCKECMSNYVKIHAHDYAETRREYRKKYREKNREKIREYAKAHPRKKYGRKYYHPEEKAIYDRIYREKNKDRKKAATRECFLRRRYGIGTDEYNRMVNEQDGRCLVCGIHKDKLTRRLHIDHDHKTGKIRGLLCTRCNALIGMAKDNTDILLATINYLKNHEGD